jgi:hypothetical protein
MHACITTTAAVLQSSSFASIPLMDALLVLISTTVLLGDPKSWQTTTGTRICAATIEGGRKGDCKIVEREETHILLQEQKATHWASTHVQVCVVHTKKVEETPGGLINDKEKQLQ